MYKICIALGWSVIKMHLENPYYYEDNELWSRINQHRFIYSDRIEDYYLENAEKEGLLDQYIEFMAACEYYDSYVSIPDKYDDMNKTISDYVKNGAKTISISISENEELNIKNLPSENRYTINRAVEDEDGPFAMYSVKAIFHVREGEDAWKYIRWIKNQISGEKEIHIIDEHLLDNDRYLKCLKDYYFPEIIPHGCKVHIHVPNSTPFRERVEAAAREANVSLEVHNYSRMTHDRYITTSKRILTFGLGLDFIVNRGHNPVVRRNFDFSLCNKKKNLPSMQEEYEMINKMK